MGLLGDLSPQGSVAIGIFVGLLSTSIQSLGLTLQRKSHLLEDAKDQYEARRPAYKRRRWQLGMFIFVLSNIVGSTIQITTLPLPVLSTLQAAGLVFNTAFATLLLKEPFTRFSLVGTVLTCAGAALIATFGAIGEPAHSLPQLLELLAQRQFILWMVFTMLIVVGTIGFAHVLKILYKRSHQEPPSSGMPRRRSRSISSSHPNITSIKRSFTANLPPALQTRIFRLRLVRGLSYALVSGILSAHSLLVAKTAVELLVRTIVDHNNQFNRYQSWLILLALVFFALTQLYYLHLGLRLCSTSVLYPFVFCIYNIIAILDGLIYFRQVSRLTPVHAGLIALGTVILLSGVLALSWRLDDTIPSDPIPSEPPPNPLTPGMGLFHSSTDSPQSPLLPTTRPQSSTSFSRTSLSEATPLLARQHRRDRGPALTIHPPPSNPAVRSIWSELDDAGSTDGDFLASLPRSPSPFLTHHPIRSPSSQQQPTTYPRARRRSRGTSLSVSPLLANSQASLPLFNPKSCSRNPSGGSTDRPQRRPQTLKTGWSKVERRRSSAPGLDLDGQPRREVKEAPPRRITSAKAALYSTPPVEGEEAVTEEAADGDANSNSHLGPDDPQRNSNVARPRNWSFGKWWSWQGPGDGKQKAGDEEPGG